MREQSYLQNIRNLIYLFTKSEVWGPWVQIQGGRFSLCGCFCSQQGRLLQIHLHLFGQSLRVHLLQLFQIHPQLLGHHPHLWFYLQLQCQPFPLFGVAGRKSCHWAMLLQRWTRNINACIFWTLWPVYPKYILSCLASSFFCLSLSTWL